ncbi:MAG: N-acetyltransferase family protein [Armatimonadota bacterium]
MVSEVEIRPAKEEDMAVINEIYNHAVRTSTATFETEEKTYEERMEWFRRHGGRYPVFVTVVDGKVVGWGSISPYSSTHNGWKFTVESSIYVDPNCKGRGLGKLLAGHTVSTAQKLGHHAIIAQVVEDNIASLKMLERHGFEAVGVLKDAGYKFDQWLNVVLMEKLLPVEDKG